MSVSISLKEPEVGKLLDAVRRMKLAEVPVKSEHELFRVKDGDTSIIMYRSGRMVHNDSEIAKVVVSEIIGGEPGYDIFLGTDEAGKGEWFGPLVVECVALRQDQFKALRVLGVQDSKSLSKKRIAELAEKMIGLDVQSKPLVLSPETYNRMYEAFRREDKSLNDLLAWAHARAIRDLLSELDYVKAKVVVDEFDAEKTAARLKCLDSRNAEVIQMKRGESETPVAAASILAKYVFEKEVDALSKKYGLDLRRIKPSDVPADVLPKVAKLHFKNVS